MHVRILRKLSRYRIILLGLAISLIYWFVGPLVQMMLNPGLTLPEALAFFDRPRFLMRATVALLILCAGFYTQYWANKHEATARSLERRLALESLLAGLSTRLVSSAPAATENEIGQALQSIGRFVEADRSYVGLYSADIGFIQRAYEWHVPEVKPRYRDIEGLPLDPLSWTMSRLKQNKIVHVPSVATLPAEAAAEKAIWEDIGIKSLIAVPMISGAMQVGFLGLNAERVRRDWLDEDIQLLGLAGEVLCGFLMRAQAEERNRQQLAQLRALREIGLEITARLDLEQLLRSVTTRAVELLGGDSGVLCLYRPDLDALEVSVLAGAEQAPVGTIVRRGEGLSGRVWESGQPLIVNEYPRWGARTAILADAPWTAMMGAPVRYGDQFLGTLGIATQKQRAFSPEDAEFLGHLARQAATAIRNARLVKALQESEERYRTISDLTSDYAYAYQVDQQGQLSLEWVTDAVTRDLGFSTPAVRGQENEREIVQANGLIISDQEKERLLSGQASEAETRLITKSGQVRWVHTYAQPIWSDQEGRVVRILGGAKDITAEKQTQELEQKQLAQLETLTKVSLEITAQLDLDTLLRSIITQAVRLLEASTGGFYLYSPTEDALEAAALIGRADVPIGLRVARGKGVAGKVLASGEPLIVNDYQNWPERPASPFRDNWNALMGVPVCWGDELLGVLSISADTPRTFSSSDREVLSLFAAHVATALRNARLVNLLQESEDRYRTISELTSDYAFSFDINKRGHFVLRWATESLTRLLGFPLTETKSRGGMSALFCPEDLPVVKEKMKEAIQGHLVEMEVRVRASGDELRWLHIAARPIWSEESGHTVRVVGGAQDITAEKQAEEIERKRLAQREVLRQMSLEITSQLDPEQLLSSIVNRAVELFESATGTVYLYRSELDALYLEVAVRFDPRPPSNILHWGEGISGRVWQSGQALIINDYQHWDGRATAYLGYPWDAVMGVPMRYGDQFLGVLSISALAPRTFSAADAELLSFFAAQAAIAIRNAQLVQALQKSEDRYRSISELTSDYAFAFDIDEQGHFAPRWATESLTRLLGFPPAELEAREGWTALVYPEDSAIAEQKLKEILQGNPVDIEGRVIAGDQVRWLHVAARPVWSEKAERVVGLIGGAQDITAEKQAKELEKNHLAQLESLRKMSLEITAQLDSRQLLAAIIAHAVDLFGLSSGAIYLYRSDIDALELAVPVGSNLARAGVILHRGEGVSGRVWESGQPLIVSDYQKWEGRAKVFDSYPWSTIMCVPVRYGDQFLGVLGVSADTPRVFSGADVELLGFFAAQAAVAIRNATLMRSLQESEERLRMVVDNMPVLFDAFDENGMALFWNKECERVTGYSSEEIVNNPRALEILCPDPLYRAAVVQYLGQLGGWYRDWELDVRCKDGATRTISWSNVSREYPIPGWWSWGTGVDITARRLAEAALRESEERFRSTFEQAAVGIAHVSTEGHFIRINRRFCDIVGYSQEEMLARTFQDITYHDDLEIDLENVNKILQGKLSTFSMEKRYIRRDRSLVWVNLTVAFVREPAGESGYFISVIEDISGRKRAEMALQQSERDLAKAQQIAHMGNWEWDVVRDTITRSEETRRIFGVDDDSVMTKDYKLAIWHPDDLQRALEIGQRMISEPTECDLRIVRPNGEIRYIHQITELVRDASGKVVRVFGINQDITQRKLAEDALRQSEAKYRALVEASPDAILVTTLDGKMINVNSQTAKMHGYESVEEMQLGAENGLELMSPPDRLRALEMIPKIMSEGAARLEGLLLRRDGSSFPGEWNTAFFLGESGAPVLIHVVRDITERKRAEERLLRYAKRLESLHEIDRAILAALSPEEIAEAALTHLQELLRCQWASVALYDYVAGQATLLAVKITEGDSLQISSKIEKGAQLPLKQITTLDALRQGRPLIREDVDAVTDLSFPGRLLASQGLRSYMVMPLVVRAELMGCLILGSSYPRTFDAETLQIAQEVASSQAIALQQARLYQQLQADRQQLEKLSMRLLEVQEAERRHIARELHDQIGQMLTGLKLILQVGANSPLETAKEENLRKAQSLLDELIADVREMSLDLRPAMLDDLGLLPTLLWHFERYTAHTGIKVEFTHRRMQGKRFRAELETVAYRVVQEALTNVARHAQIGQVRVSLWVEQDILNVQIRDQGVGFDLHKANGEQNTGGLAGMQERVNLLGGKLVVKSASGSGVTMTARLPLK